MQQKLQRINELEMKLMQYSDIIDRKSLMIKDLEQEKKQLKLKMDALESSNTSLKHEIQHLQISLNENKELKDKYFKQVEETQQKHQELFTELNIIQKDKVAVDEIK